MTGPGSTPPDPAAARAPQHFRVERTEYADIEVDVSALLASDWAEDRARFDTDEEFVEYVLWEIGVRDLTYSGDFITVGETDTEEDIKRVS